MALWRGFETWLLSSRFSFSNFLAIADKGINIGASRSVLGTLLVIWYQITASPSVACWGNTWENFLKALQPNLSVYHVCSHMKRAGNGAGWVSCPDLSVSAGPVQLHSRSLQGSNTTCSSRPPLSEFFPCSCLLSNSNTHSLEEVLEGTRHTWVTQQGCR